jgi:hypothetical protein
MSYSSKLRLLLLTIMALGIGIALLLRNSGDSSNSTEEKPVASKASQPAPSLAVEALPQYDVLAPESSDEMNDSISAHQSGPLSAGLPTVETAREEVKANPHAPPKSLIQFANQVADRFDEVEKYPDQAESFLAELEECVRDSANRLTSARALCLTNAEDLGAMFPQYADRVNQLKSSAPPEVRDLARATSMGYEE